LNFTGKAPTASNQSSHAQAIRLTSIDISDF
jgi:hypothetical protein